jgi:regulatory protein
MAFQRKRSESKDSDLSRTPEEWDELARTLLLNKLTRGPRSKAQLAQHLADREVPHEIAESLLVRFEEVGLIDDASYALAFARDRRASRGLAKPSLKRELAAAGISEMLANDALEQFDSNDDLELAVTLVRKRWSSVSKLDWQVRQRRLGGYLGRRGFSSAAIGEAIKTVERESNY